MVDSVHCHACGAELGVDAHACTRCGAAVAVAEPPTYLAGADDRASEVRGFFGVLALALVGAVVAFSVILFLALLE